MATLALSVAGSAIGGALMPAGLSIFGTAVTGAALGSRLGALAGSFVDAALFSSSGQTRPVEGPRLSDLQVTTSTEGSPIPRLYGRARLGGQVIWATPLEEVAVTTGAGGSSKGMGGGAAAPSTDRTDYAYYANFAVALCEGPVTGIGRVWANGQELDLSQYTWRFHDGRETQAADSLIVARWGAENAPAYQGIAYLVFENMPLASFGNRLPQLSFEVHRAVDAFEQQIRAVVLIPGSGEFVYAPTPVTRRTGRRSRAAENTHTRLGGTDWQVSLDQLQEVLPAAETVSLVVSWFGSDLRAEHCLLRPAVEDWDKATDPLSWTVAGLGRTEAPMLSLHDGRVAYGGTPSDQTVVAAIQDLAARGKRVTLTPFILMDIPVGNALPDPWTGAASQPSYPWRGRISVDPAPGRSGSPDKSATATSQLAAFIGTATPAHYAIANGAVVYSGPAEWSLRRMVLHYAKLAVAAGGVDAFVIGSELRGLTQVRSAAGTYPFVAALRSLAADVKSIVGAATKVTYAADWSEYFGHQPADGSGDVHFHLDPLWASPSIDAIAIDCYWPLADWRDGDNHLDRAAGAQSIYDLDYLKSNIAGGEGFDWYYASAADRTNQVRTPITDAAGKPWVFRYKDLKSWWLNRHYDRPSGIESATSTAWVPQSKPVWFTEIGAPAVDKGANQPNVFVDPKSSESFLPYGSRGNRDDHMQRAYLQAFHEGLNPDHPGYLAGSNPLSSVYGQRMIDLSRVHVYAWDARPYPAFPRNATVWGDSANWRLGHWINGRIAGQTLAAVVRAILESYGFDKFDVSGLHGIVSGYVLDRAMTAREALSPLELAYFFDSIESEGLIAFRHRGAEGPVLDLAADALVETQPEAPLYTLTRGQETDLPAVARLTYSSAENDYRQAVVETRRLIGASGRLSHADLAIVMASEQASRTADAWLYEAWAARERASFTVPPSLLHLEPGDVVSFEVEGRPSLYRITEIGDRGERAIQAMSIDTDIYGAGAGVVRAEPTDPDVATGPVAVDFLDLPLLTGNEEATSGYVAAARTPWPGTAAVFRSPTTTGFTLAALVTRAATTGLTLDPIPAGPEGRLDRAVRVRVHLDQGALTSVLPVAMLGGANAAAIQGPDGAWEVIQFETATLVAPSTYELRTLLRAQAGTEGAMAALLPAGAAFVLLDDALTPVRLARTDIGLPLQWRYGPGSHDIGDTAFTTTTHAYAGVGLRPLSPVHIRGQRSGGDLVISWVRRTRVGGDSWNQPDVPLSEESERYEIDILDGATVKRTLTTSTPSVIYSQADQIADFGLAPSTVHVRIAQIGALGRGAARVAAL